MIMITRLHSEREARSELGLRVLKVLGTHFHEITSPGLLMYNNFIVAAKPLTVISTGG
jgi:hypothetical protein